MVIQYLKYYYKGAHSTSTLCGGKYCLARPVMQLK